MLRLNERQRGVLAEKLADTGNLAVAGLVFGQFVTGQGYSVALALGGLVIWVVLFTCSMRLFGRTDRS